MEILDYINHRLLSRKWLINKFLWSGVQSGVYTLTSGSQLFRGEFNWFMFKVYLEKINGVRIFEFIFSCIFTRQHAQQSQFEYVNTTTSQTACNCKVISLKHIYQEVIDKFSNFRLDWISYSVNTKIR